MLYSGAATSLQGLVEYNDDVDNNSDVDADTDGDADGDGDADADGDGDDYLVEATLEGIQPYVNLAL